MTFDASEHPRATDGKFAEKLGASPEVSLSPVFERSQARAVQPGDLVDVQLTTTTGGPFGYAYAHNPEFRRAWKAAGRPEHLRVLAAGRAAEDGHTDNAITFDLGGPVELTFHRDREMLVARADTDDEAPVLFVTDDDYEVRHAGGQGAYAVYSPDGTYIGAVTSLSDDHLSIEDEVREMLDELSAADGR